MARIAARSELEAALALLDQPSLFEQPCELAQPRQGTGGVVTEQVARTFEVDLGERPGLRRRVQQVLEVVEVAQRLEHAGDLAEPERVDAVEREPALPGKRGKRALEVATQRVELPVEVQVAEELVGQGLELRALLRAHGVQQPRHLCHGVRELFEQLVERLRVAGHEVAMPLHEALEVGRDALFPLLEHLVELGEHVLDPTQLAFIEVLHAGRELVEMALQQLVAELLDQRLEVAPGAVVDEVVRGQLPHETCEVGRHEIKLFAA